MAQPAKRWDLLRQGIASAKAGEKEHARPLLREAAEENPQHEITWLWLATVAEEPAELEHSLERALAINPSNDKARAWLERSRSERRAKSTPESQIPSQPQSPAQPQTAPPGTPAPSTKWQCPMCDQSFTAKPERCVRCRSILSISDLGVFFEDNDVHRELLRSAIERLESFGQTGDPAIRYRTLGLAYLNLGQPREALIHLRTAADLRREDQDLRCTVEELKERLARVQKKAVPLDRPNKQKSGTVEVDVATLVAAQLAAPRAAPEGRAGAGEERRPVIQVVDDSPTVRKLVQVTLERQGYQVQAASNGMESLAMLQEATPDLVILDVTMPHLDGYKICRVIKDNELTSHLPVVFLSGNDGFLNKVRGRMAGAVEYLTKPVDPETLVRIVRQNLSQ